METRIEPERTHLDPLALDALRAGAGTPEDAAHVATCPCCRAALAGIVLLQEALTSTLPPIPAVPRDLELQILRGYRDRLRPPRAQPAIPALVRRWACPAIGAAAAAALLLAIYLIPLGDPGVVPRSPAPVAPASEEMGTLAPGHGVDIVDAFRLALALRDGRPAGVGWDADGNGLVDDSDVSLLARRAVTL